MQALRVTKVSTMYDFSKASPLVVYTLSPQLNSMHLYLSIEYGNECVDKLDSSSERSFEPDAYGLGL